MDSLNWLEEEVCEIGAPKELLTLNLRTYVHKCTYICHKANSCIAIWYFSYNVTLANVPSIFRLRNLHFN